MAICEGSIPEVMAVLQRSVDEAKRVKLRWERGFQRWCDENQNDGTTEYGKCGYGVICDLCSGNDVGRPCVRAWNAWLRDSGVVAHYDTQTFEDAWNGRLTESYMGLAEEVKKDE